MSVLHHHTNGTLILTELQLNSTNKLCLAQYAYFIHSYQQFNSIATNLTNSRFRFRFINYMKRAIRL